MTLIEEIKQDEGFSPTIYLCEAGKRTIGYGFNLDAGIDEELATIILEYQVNKTINQLKRHLSFWYELTPARQDVFVNMAFNLGIDGFLGFRKMLAAAGRGDVDAVCQEMVNSRWYTQVRNRAERLILKYRKG